MIWGNEGIWTWDADGASPFVMNDRSVWPASDHIRIDRVNKGLAEAEDVRRLSTGRLGESPGRSYRRGKTWTIEGRVRARSRAGLRELEDEFTAAFADQESEKVMVVDAPPFAPAGASRRFLARALTLDIPDEEIDPRATHQGHQRSFVLTVRASDPRYYDDTLQTDSVGPVATNVATGSITVTNGGKAMTDPVFEIEGPLRATGTEPNAISPVRVATTDNLPEGAFVTGGGTLYEPAGEIAASGATSMLEIDGVLLDVGDRVMVKDRTDNKQNGPYVVKENTALDPTTGSPRWRLARAPDANASGDLVQYMNAQVLEGATHANKVFRLTTAGPYTLNTTGLVWAQSPETPLGVELHNDTVDASLILPYVVLGSGQVMEIDFANRTIQIDGIEAPAWYLHKNSDWWDAGVPGLAVGDNDLRIKAYRSDLASSTYGPTLTVNWRDAFWG